MTTPFHCRPLGRDDILLRIDELCDVLEDCVRGGASVSFMLPITREVASGFWQGVAASVARGERVLVIAENTAARIIGTAQIILDQPPNQPHRADVAKLLVHQSARRQGVARVLMDKLDDIAKENGKTLLVLDTATGSNAEYFYANCGWQRVGEIPGYALMPDGNVTGTTIFYKNLTFAAI
ncbi:GNAT family N-acetyltransferase [Enterobacter sp. ENT03]|uniref:GNAT family N-acetyltransferase n=1 Tax=Enterobacter sp. ENT03 TaxID=2854780 RepID=UPI001C46B20D|nr:GNAT family N-acetyltransferase [Enterobacter sp. ENT03]MBV7403204.1 GNAT family N-acetyltransferase [Enterobacter sp. ENT03]